MKTIIIAVIVTLITLSAQAQNTEWSITKSSVKFKIKNAGFNVDGSLGSLTGVIKFEETKTIGNNIDVTIDSKTLSTNNNKRDEHLRKAEYFDVAKYPKINMKAVLFTKEKDGTYKGFFKLILKDKTKDVVIPFTFKSTGITGIFKGTFTINRLDYGVGESSFILNDFATIIIELIVIKK
ncbi:MAG: YceI family protein [Bacteroidia bacterium]|nr:YceI family protein [Bacteroidia bacterium]